MKKNFLRLLFEKKSVEEESPKHSEEALEDLPVSKLFELYHSDNISEEEKIRISKILMSRNVTPM